MTPYYEDDWCTIYHGDCLDVLPTITGIDMVFTSPPYNLGVSSGGGLKGAAKSGKWTGASLANGYNNHSDDMVLVDYEAWQRSVLVALWATLSPVGAIFYNHKPRVQNGELWTPLDIQPGLPVRQIITWARSGGINFAPTHFLPTYEWIVVYARDEWRLKSKGASGVGDLWRVHQESGSEHPTPFPLQLPTIAIEATTARTVLDPFMGSGTTLRAAKDLGRKAIGIELSERYCEIAVKRLAQEVLPL